MKNKLRLIDINILSTYMGRFLTAIVTVLVLVITVSALLGGRAIVRPMLAEIQVPSVGARAETLSHYEPLRLLVAEATGWRVSLVVENEADEADADLYLTPLRDFLELREALDLEPVLSLKSAAGQDSAVIVALPGPRSLDPLRDIAPGDLALGARGAINRAWIQLDILSSDGFDLAERAPELEFSDEVGHANRAIYAVLFGEKIAGACMLSDIEQLSASGALAPGELDVIAAAPTLPDAILSSRGRHAATLLVSLPGVLDSPRIDTKQWGYPQARPPRRAEMERATELYQRVGQLLIPER